MNGTNAESPLNAMRAWLKEGAVQAGILDLSVPFGAEFTRAGTSYGIGMGPSTHTTDVLGNDIAVYQFVFTARLPYGPDPAQNLRSSALMSALCDWINAQNRQYSFPQIPGYDCSRVHAENPLMVSVDAASAVYQLQIRVEAEAAWAQESEDNDEP